MKKLLFTVILIISMTCKSFSPMYKSEPKINDNKIILQGGCNDTIYDNLILIIAEFETLHINNPIYEGYGIYTKNPRNLTHKEAFQLSKKYLLNQIKFYNKYPDSLKKALLQYNGFKFKSNILIDDSTYINLYSKSKLYPKAESRYKERRLKELKEIVRITNKFSN